MHDEDLVISDYLFESFVRSKLGERAATGNG
jgi:hypothetical protein